MHRQDKEIPRIKSSGVDELLSGYSVGRIVVLCTEEEGINDEVCVDVCGYNVNVDNRCLTNKLFYLHPTPNGDISVLKLVIHNTDDSCAHSYLETKYSNCKWRECTVVKLRATPFRKLFVIPLHR